MKELEVTITKTQTGKIFRIQFKGHTMSSWVWENGGGEINLHLDNDTCNSDLQKILVATLMSLPL